jgi:hypothetical protein
LRDTGPPVCNQSGGPTCCLAKDFFWRFFLDLIDKQREVANAVTIKLPLIRLSHFPGFIPGSR